jgi:hypothetical protein
MKIQLKQIGPFNPVEVIEVEEEKVKDLLATKNYILVETAPKKTELNQSKCCTNDKSDKSEK